MQPIRAFTTACALAAAIGATPSSAAVMLDTCTADDLSVKVLDCVGFSTGNLLAPNPWRVEAQIDALRHLGFDFDGNYERVLQTMLWSDMDGVWTVTTPLTGITFIGTSRRHAKDNHVETAFFKIEGLGETSLSLAGGKESPVVFYNSNLMAAVPEPGTWALMLFGFAGIGSMLRKRKKNAEPRFRFGMSEQ